MDIFKEATRQQLRFPSSKGELTLEQLWTVSIEDLDKMAVSLDEEHKASGKKSFLVKRSVKDKTAKLKLDVVLDVLNTKAEEAEAAQIAKENKEHNAKILGIMQEKKDENLKGMSLKELEKQLR